jgi:hypothetical protein
MNSVAAFLSGLLLLGSWMFALVVFHLATEHAVAAMCALGMAADAPDDSRTGCPSPEQLS